MVTGLGTLICQVNDMDRAVAFYRDVLGFTPGIINPHWSDFSVPGGGKIGLHPPFRDAGAKGAGWIVGLATDDIADLKVKLAASGYPTDHKYHDTPGGVVLDFADPDGNPLQAIQYGAKASDLA